MFSRERAPGDTTFDLTLFLLRKFISRFLPVRLVDMTIGFDFNLSLSLVTTKDSLLFLSLNISSLVGI